MPNQFKFNSWVELNTAFDINLYETTFRGYDPPTGRFHQIDPLSGKFPEWSPYSFAFNNPIGLNDPMGAEPVDPKKWINSQLLSGKYGEFKRDKTGGSNIGELLGKLVEDINAKDLWGKEDIPSYEEYNDVVDSFYEGKTLETVFVTGHKRQEDGDYIAMADSYLTPLGTPLWGIEYLLGTSLSRSNYLDRFKGFNEKAMLKANPSLRSRPVNIHIPGAGRRLEIPRNYAKLAGDLLQGASILSAGVSFANDINKYSSGEISGAHFIVNTIFIGVGFIGPWGAGVSMIYGFAEGYIWE